MNRLILPALIVTMLAGCGGGKAPELSPVRRDIDNFSAKAAVAFKRGDFEQAKGLYLNSLRMSMSIEDSDATAVNLINLAAVERALGDPESARLRLSGVFEPVSGEVSIGRLAEAAMLQSLIEIDAGGLAEAEDWARKAEAHCSRAGCGFKGRISNLMGRIALLRDNHAGAIAHAQRGLSLARAESEPSEEANALRLMADAYAVSGAHERARVNYIEALEIDKRLGLSSKIALDLRGAGVALAAMGKSAEAQAYLVRAINVSASAGDIEAENVTRDILKRLKQADK